MSQQAIPLMPAAQQQLPTDAGIAMPTLLDSVMVGSE